MSILILIVYHLQGLMCPYMSFLIQPSIELLKSFTTSNHDGALWSAVLETLTKSMNYDDGGKMILIIR